MGGRAVYELARILDAFRKELREAGLTYNVGLVLGGATAALNANGTGGEATGKTNVVPPVALALGDMRTLHNDQPARVQAKTRAIVAEHPPETGAALTVDDGSSATATTD